jgi:hypothetical protein
MYLAFYKGRGRLFDRAIRMFTRGPYSHVELVMKEPTEGAEFTGFSASGRDGGVRIKTISYEIDKWDFVEIPWANSLAWLKAKRYLDQPYDYLGIFLSQLLPLRRHLRGAWFCSELCAFAIGFDAPQIYSPNSFYAAVTARAAAHPNIEFITEKGGGE